MTQLFAEHIFGGSEISLMLVMWVLHYLVIMRKSICVVLLLISCVGGFLHSIIQVSIVCGLPFCGPNITDHFMCDIFPLLKLICADTFVIGILVVANGGLICSVVFLLLSPMELSCTL